MIHGPGCPVCVLPIGRIDLAIRLALERGDPLHLRRHLRVPASDGLSLMKAQGARRRHPHGLFGADALKIARDNPDGGGVLRHRLRDHHAADGGGDQAGRRSAEKLQRALLPRADAVGDHQHPRIAGSAPVGHVPLDGFIGPAHVSTIIGSRPYEFFAEEYRKPVVIAGFEPLDVMQAILMLVRQVNEGRAEVENEFTRAVTRDGNLKAQNLVAEVFELRRSFEWRGLGELPYSALRIRENYAEFDAERRFAVEYQPVPTTRPASAAPFCAASSGRRTARSSARVHAGKPGRLLHGVVRRRLRRALLDLVTEKGLKERVSPNVEQDAIHVA
jgi:hydrogenase expression/formation protein HypD